MVILPVNPAPELERTVAFALGHRMLWSHITKWNDRYGCRSNDAMSNALPVEYDVQIPWRWQLQPLRFEEPQRWRRCVLTSRQDEIHAGIRVNLVVAEVPACGCRSSLRFS